MQIVRRHPPATVPCASKHSTQQNQAPRPLQHKQAPSNSTRQKQHSTRQPVFTRSLQQLPGTIHLVLQGIHLVSTKFYKGLSITLHCNTRRSVCSKIITSCAKNNSTRKLILSRYSIYVKKLSYIQAVLVIILHKIH